jgi:hypothetical protein
MNKLGIQLVQNHADFRLMSKRALGELMKYKEGNVFLRGLVPLVGFRSAEVTYDRKERTAGESKYPLKKMLAFAFDGITSFSVAPIRLLTLLGGASFLFSIAFGIYALIQKYLDHRLDVSYFIDLACRRPAANGDGSCRRIHWQDF